MREISKSWISDLWFFDEVDSLIKGDYQNIIVKRYLPVFSEIVKENSRLMIENNIPAIDLDHPHNSLTFLQAGVFMQRGRYIFPQKTEPDSLKGVLEIARVYQNDGSISIQEALRVCLNRLTKSVEEVIEKKR